MTSTLCCDVKLELDRFDLNVTLESSARVLAVFGASGSGKTSLLENVAGLRPRATGVVRFEDEPWLDTERGVRLAPEKRHIGYVPQDGLLFPHLDVRKNLLAGAHRDADREATLRLVSRTLELEPLWARDVTTLSGGERQRVALGRALCSKPRLLLLDEPLAALDLPLRRRLLPFLRRVREEFRIPMLLVSHDPTEVQALADEVAVLGAGRLLSRGEPRRVLKDPSVFPLAEDAGFENTLPCTVTAVGADSTTARVGSSLTLSARGARVAPGAETLLVFPARDVILATSRPEGLSARNVIPAQISATDAVGERRLLSATVAPDAPDLVAELSAAACRDLDLQRGSAVFLVIKSSSVTVLPMGRSAAPPAG